MVDGIFGGVVDVLVVLVLVLVLVLVDLLEERRHRGRESRLTTKHGIVDGLGGGRGRTRAWKATAAALDDMVDGIFGGVVDGFAVLVGR